jgi:hypothetical protein
MAAVSSRARRVWPAGGAGLNLSGNGVLIGMWDAGNVRASHQEFGGRVTNLDNAALNNHATHVAGTMIASGFNPAAKGSAFGASVEGRDWDDDLAEAQAAAADGMVLSSHAYGPLTGWDYGDHGVVQGLATDWYWFGSTAVNDTSTEDYAFGFYTDEARNWDQLAFNSPYYTSVWAGGDDRGQGPTSQPTGYYWTGLTWAPNIMTSRQVDGSTSGYDTIAGPAVAKNTITVGAVNDIPTYTGPSSVVAAPFSSAGPTDDGRIKPDFVANGVGLLSSTAASDSSYGELSGSSMATASATGSLALLVQHYRATHEGADMRSATLKALAINAADEAGGAAGPDYVFGWGLLNVEKAAQAINRDQADPFQIQELTLNNAQTSTYRIYSDGTQPIKVTVAWTDRPGSPVAPSIDPPTGMLVNDLDLRISKNGTTYLPWVLNRSTPGAAATTGDNMVDNVEQVVVPAPTVGIYTVTVSHKGALMGGSQDFSLTGSGYYTQPTMSSFTINGANIATGNSTNGRVVLNAPAPPGGFTFVPRPVAGVTMAPSIKIAAGETVSPWFPIIANFVPDQTTTKFYSVWMDANGQSIGKVLTVVPLKLKAISFDKDTVVQGQSFRLTVQLTGPAPTGGYTLQLRRSPTFWVIAPETIIVPKGATTTNVDILIRPNAPATSVASLIVSHPLGNTTVSLGKLFTIVH